VSIPIEQLGSKALRVAPARQQGQSDCLLALFVQVYRKFPRILFASIHPVEVNVR